VSRATPPPEHLDYLQEIGVDILGSGSTSVHAGPAPAAPGAVAKAAPARSARPARVPSPAPAAPWDVIVHAPPAVLPVPPRRVPKHLPTWWPVVEWVVGLALLLALLLLLAPLFMSRLGLGQELPASATQTSATSAARSTEEHETVKRPTTNSRKAKTAPAAGREDETGDDAAPSSAKAPPKGQEPKGAPAGPKSDPAGVPAAAVTGPPAVTPIALSEPTARPAEAGDETESGDGESTPAQPSAPSGLPGTSHTRVETVVGIAFLAGLGYLGWDRRRLAERVSKIEGVLEPSPPEVVESSAPVVEVDALPDPSSAPALFTADSPQTALSALIAEAKRHRFPTLPATAIRPWGTGVTSITGNVRRENQDAAIAFEVGSTAVLIVADGLGGLPHGQDAARLAVGAAALSIAEELGRESAPPALPELISEKGLLDAASALCRRARASGWVTNHDGFRTTIILVVATPSTYGYAYLGDGGGLVLRQTGASESFLVPQKADGVANVVAGSLGPIMQGSPAVGQLPRRPGDALLIGTDGVFDRVPSDFGASVAKLLSVHNGNAQAVASLIVSDFASAKEGSRFVCDDNMSLAILCTPAPRPAAAELTVRRPQAARR